MALQLRDKAPPESHYPGNGSTSIAPLSQIGLPRLQSPEDSSTVNSTPRSTNPRPSSAVKKPQASALRNATKPGTEQSPVSPHGRHGSEGVLVTPGGPSETPVAGRKSVQFKRDADDPEDTEEDVSRQPSINGDHAEPQSKTQSLLSKLKALTISQTSAHTRSTSAVSADRTTGSKDLDGNFSPPTGRSETAFPMTVEEDDSEVETDADADAEESAAENRLRLPVSRKRRRNDQRRDGLETEPNSPLRHGFLSAQVTADESQERPRLLPRSATDTDLAGRAHVSEDEGRRRKAGSESPWRLKQHSRRNVSYGGQRQATSSASPDGERPRTLRDLATIVSSHLGSTKGEESETPKTPKRRALGERGTTFSTAKWRSMGQKLKFLGQAKKRDRTIDHEKSAELLAELAAGGPAALMLASMFQRDEHGARRIPIILEQLKVNIADSYVEKERGKDADPDKSTSSDRHLIFRIELEYGNGINRMKWVVKRSLWDFINLHAKYKIYYSTGKAKGRAFDGTKLPKFPKKAFPYSRSFRSMEDEQDDEDEQGHETDGAVTDTDPTTPRHQRRGSYGFGRRKLSAAGVSGASNVATALASPGVIAGAAMAKRDGFDERRRKKLEVYLRQMIKFMLFRPESNRLCKFLEVSALGMRLAAEGSYHGKEGFLVIQSAKGLDFRKALTPSNVKGRHTPKWFLVRHSYVVCVDSPEEMHIYDVFLFDSDFTIRPSKKAQRLRDQNARDIASTTKENVKHPQHHRLKLQNSERKLKLLARNERQLAQFEESIKQVIQNSPWVKQNRFDSFAPIRPNCFAQWLVDGRDHMWVVSRAISQAKDVIYIHDWWLSPELYMRRPSAISGKWRLDRLLKRKAEEGVKVFVIVYRNIESAVPIDSQYTKFSLLDLHPNVFVQRSPNQFRQNTFFWAHHEKLCIVDHTLAFIGGIDLCFGRWDTPQHTVVDDKPTGFEANDLPKDADHCQLWPGKDYSNPRVQDFYSLNKPYEEMYDRSQIARMPWHDISMQVVGQPARDLTRHFVQRWNYILRQRKPTRPTPFLLPPPDFNPADLEALGLDGTCEVQILRSAGPWSLGTPDKTEHSIMNAYVKMIEDSEHFVYIENQFFISSCETEQTTIQNLIGDALVERIIRAHKNDEAWRAVLVIPLIPGFQNTVDQEGGTSVRLIMQYQYRSICRGESSIFGRLRAQGIEPAEYIEFYALRTWGKIGPKKALVTEQLYIHAKCMVVDDRIAIIGSANINERSMLGNRDSECAAVVRDTDMIWSRMNGQSYQVGRFPHSLRMRLMREHLGLDVDKIMEDAQIIENEHRKNSGQMPVPESLMTTNEDPDRPGSPGPSEFSHADTMDRIPSAKIQDTTADLFDRSEKIHSFNHDTDWEQADNPNLKSNRKLTEDPRVTKNETHRLDVEGQGFDNMEELAQHGLADGRDTTLVRGNKEVLISDLATEGRTSSAAPMKHGDTLRIPSYVAKMDAPNPPMPPRPSMARMDTVALGLPMLSQLPALPELDDTDIGGPTLEKTPSKSSTHQQHPLMSELKHPAVDRDCMQDPLHDAFMFGTWHEIAENNTKIYRAVFRCMPDNQVRDWKEYHEYVAYEQRFSHMQGMGAGGVDSTMGSQKAKLPNSSDASKSGPPGAGAKAPAAEIKAVIGKGGSLGLGAKEKIGNLVSSTIGDGHPSEKAMDRVAEKESKWAVDMNRAQVERQGTNDPVLNEKTRLQTVPEDLQTQRDGGGYSPTNTATTTADEKTRDSTDASTTIVAEKSITPPQYVGYSDALNMNVHTNVKKRRRATTRGSRAGQFSAGDDILPVEEAEELLNCVQGHLVVWPYDWLEKVEAGGNWLYPLDQLTPIEIYV